MEPLYDESIRKVLLFFMIKKKTYPICVNAPYSKRSRTAHFRDFSIHNKTVRQTDYNHVPLKLAHSIYTINPSNGKIILPKYSKRRLMD